MTREDLEEFVGKTFGMLTVVSRADDATYTARGKEYKTRKWNCICTCGGSATCYEADLKRGNSTSCGCKQKAQAVKMGKERKTHGMSKTKEENAYRHMMQRCYSKNSAQYKNYGGRGIRVCERWLGSFENFLIDIGRAPSKLHSIDRIDSNGDYSPENCRWATWTDQQRNRRNNRTIEIDGETKTLAEWCEIHDVPYQRVHQRITKLGMSPLIALTKGLLKTGPKEKAEALAKAEMESHWQAVEKAREAQA